LSYNIGICWRQCARVIHNSHPEGRIAIPSGFNSRSVVWVLTTLTRRAVRTSSCTSMSLNLTTWNSFQKYKKVEFHITENPLSQLKRARIIIKIRKGSSFILSSISSPKIFLWASILRIWSLIRFYILVYVPLIFQFNP